MYTYLYTTACSLNFFFDDPKSLELPLEGFLIAETIYGAPKQYVLLHQTVSKICKMAFCKTSGGKIMLREGNRKFCNLILVLWYVLSLAATMSGTSCLTAEVQRTCG